MLALLLAVAASRFNTEGTEARAQRAQRSAERPTQRRAPHKGKRTDLKIGHYGDAHFSEMAAEFAEAGEDDEFAGAGGGGVVLHVAGVLMRDLAGLEADAGGGFDVAARGSADHPPWACDNFALCKGAAL